MGKGKGKPGGEKGGGKGKGRGYPKGTGKGKGKSGSFSSIGGGWSTADEWTDWESAWLSWQAWNDVAWETGTAVQEGAGWSAPQTDQAPGETGSA